jgi:glycerol-3-phosphate acyltransferase PlsX
MGGDFAPREVVAGALHAARSQKDIGKLWLVGDEAAIRAEIARVPGPPAPLEIVHASESIGMDEAPATAVRRKRDSSIVRAIDLVKSGQADAIFSAGNTGAVVAGCTLRLRTLPGVERPAIATVLPAPERPFVLLDAGANTDCTPKMLAQFAVMGSVYARAILGRKDPVVGLLSIGGEDAKGNATTKEAFRILDASGMNFRGNVESHDIFQGGVDVVVCDGFVGNVVLKTAEAAAQVAVRWFKQEFTANPLHMLGALLLRRGIARIKRRTDPARYGGAPLLGVHGIAVIGHGASNALAVESGIRVSVEAVRGRVDRAIADGVAALRGLAPEEQQQSQRG